MDKRAILADLTKIDFQKPNRIRLGTSYSFSVGGIGDVRQSAFRFKHYRFDKVQNRIFPVYDLQDLATWNTEYGMSGQELLVSLLNLYDSINRPDGSPLPYTEQIMQWCTEYYECIISESCHQYSQKLLPIGHGLSIDLINFKCIIKSLLNQR